MRANQHTDVLTRLESQIAPEPNSGCWLWMGYATGRGNDLRPRINLNGRPRIAYRVSYEMYVGPIPAGKHVCHKCDVPICLNPAHLFLGDARANAQDAIAKGRATFQRHPEATAERARQLGLANTWSRGRRHKGVVPDDQKASIVARLIAGDRLIDIAATYGVTKQAISQLAKREQALAALAKAADAASGEI